jgi:hypothetical protein
MCAHVQVFTPAGGISIKDGRVHDVSDVSTLA